MEVCYAGKALEEWAKKEQAMEPFRYNAAVAAEIATRVRAGEELSDWFEMALASVAGDHERMTEMFEATSYHNLAPGEVEHGLAALAAFHESLLVLRAAAASKSEELLLEGVELAQQAEATMAQAIQINNKVGAEAFCDFLAE